MDGDVIDLRSILGLLRRRIWLIVLVVVLALGAAGIALLVLKPVYTATALVLVDPSKKNLLDPESQLAASSGDSQRVDSEVELVKSETVLLAVAKELNLATDPEFGLKLGMRDMLLAFFRISEPQLPSGDEALKTIVDNLRSAVSVQRKGLTYLIAVNGQSGRPGFAADIANSVARNYIKQQLDAKVASTLASRDVIQARITDASAAVAASENAFDTFVDENLDRISEVTGRTEFATIRSEIEEVSRSRAEDSATADSAQKSLDQRDWASVASSLKDEAVANLERQRVALADQLAGAADGSATAVDLKASLAGIEAELKTAATSAVSALRTETAGAQQRASELRTQLRDSILSSNLPPEILTSIYELQQNGTIARTSYQTLLTRQNDLDTQAYLQVPDSRVAAEAVPPSAPSFPNPRVILLLAGVVGAALGVGLALLIENFFGGFTSEPQAESILKVPVVTSTPRQRQPKRNGVETQSVADALVLSPLSVYSESIRRIRVGIDQAIRRLRPIATPAVAPRQGAVIVVSSAAPNEGKTTMSLSLARAYALSGLSTLLVDCDLRKPSVHKQLGMEASEGLLEYLVGSDQANFDLKSIMTVDAGSGAQIVLGSRRSDIATDQLIAGKTLTRLIDAARKNFDVVVLDTPPVGPVVDGLYLAAMADAILFVVKWSATPQQEVRAAVSALVAAKPETTPLLVALNQQDANPRAYRGKYAGYYAEA
jgi:capsular exopolysaccharide synthesis family protein